MKNISGMNFSNSSAIIEKRSETRLTKVISEDTGGLVGISWNISRTEAINNE